MAEENAKDSKVWLGILAFFVVLALLGPTLIFRGLFDPDHGKKERPGASAVYYTSGEVKELEHGQREIMIRHEEIPGVMPAMTMPFTARDSSVLHPFQVGDRVSFRFRLTDRGAFIEEIAAERPSAGATP